MLLEMEFHDNTIDAPESRFGTAYQPYATGYRAVLSEEHLIEYSAP